MPPVWILALDASLARCSAAVVADGVTRAERLAEGDRGHAALLPPMVEAVLAEAGIPAAALSAVAAVVGPGGFTGLRAALALAEGVALAAGCPGIGVTTGEALAAALPPALRESHEAWSAIDTRRGRVVLERFPPGAAAAAGPAETLAPDALPPPPPRLLLLGDAAAALAPLLPGARLVPEARLPQAAAAARVAALRLAGRLPSLPLRPLYAEPPAVRLPG
ncbi:tRNA (adenosine(37)-N6)-threonylcarbamoyltransferase complex dimerization subunit type 1 TsaB [Siccirubricoccus phaeus]|uniref:tRNA (adenosine(37)-N6)-threonylcarbamoyltransferase complex dimerization subunit type 1 TsaB n=1 Tax=Siccirubricoccus phaeus TaxID=2595053 RepID=UPI0011F09E15|nr:tRNA (adenosine(37)-N6)-threonylcarbamoyltransferase complex dimerization subunit type 1 TsaB [Siccirubricoccus phaeus]